MNNSLYSLTAVAVANDILFDFSERLKNLNMLFDYNEYIFPVIYIDVLLTLEEFKNITERPDMRIKLSLRRFRDVGNENYSLPSYEYCFRDKIFTIVQEDNYNVKDVARNANTRDINMINARFVLIQEEDLQSNKKNLSGSFANCSMKSLLAYLMSQLNQDKRTIISNPDNTSVIPQILIPFNNVLKTFEYIDKVYGIYKNGIKVFFDLDTNYILNRNKNDFDSNGLSKNVIIEIPTTANLGRTSRDNSITVLSKDFNYSKMNTLKSEFTGTNNAFVMNNESRTILNKKWEESNLDNKQKVYYQKYSNPFLQNQVNPENDMLITANCQNANYNLINFVNEYSIQEFNNKSLSEIELTLMRYSHKFVRTRDNVFELYSSMAFKKI